MAMTIPKETLQTWKSLRGKGDVDKLRVILKKKNNSSVYHILSTGKCSSRALAAKLIKFHADLGKEVSELKTQLDQD